MSADHLELSLGKLALSASFGAQMIGAALAFAAQVVLGHWLGVRDFGTYSAVMSFVVVAALIATLGGPGAAFRLIPEALKSSSIPVARHLVGHTLATCVLGGTLVASLATAGVLLATQADILFALAFWVLIVSMTLIHFGNDVGRAFGRNLSTYGASIVLRPGLLILCVLASIAFSQTGSTTAAISFTAVAAVVCVAVQVTVVGQMVGWGGLKPRRPRSDWLRRNPAFAAFALLTLLLTQVDILVVALFLAPEQLGAYAAASKLAAVVQIVVVAIHTILIPKVAGSSVSSDAERLSIVARSAARLSIACASFVALPLIAAPSFVLGLFGDGFSDGSSALIALTAGQLVSIAAGPAGVMLMYTNHERSALLSYGLSVIVYVAACALGASLWGLHGAGIATGIAAAMTGLVIAHVARAATSVRTTAW